MLPAVGLTPLTSRAAERETRAGLDRFFRKKTVTIAVTDSGLGGLSVMADAVSRMKMAGVFKSVDFVFFNALFSAGGGYNTLARREDKLAILESALEGLEKRYRPDLILIACHTLSTLYDDTPFARRAEVPVVGIVGAAVEMIAAGLRAEPGAAVILFGTPTTISERAHERGLEAAGIAPDRIITQACPELESFIERDCASEETGLLISGFVDEAVRKMPAPRRPVLAALCCSHYGYSLPLWTRAFAEAGVEPLGVLNPNGRMADFLFGPERAGRFPGTKVTARVVSMVQISPETVLSLGGWLERLSPETAAALAAYQFVPDLFGPNRSRTGSARGKH